MKIIKEDIENLERSINDEKVDVVGSMPITMADAFYDSEKKQEQIDKEMNEKESKVKLNKVLGAEKQPVPDLPVLPKTTLDESLFEDYEGAREYTNKLLDMVDEGLLDPKDLIASMALYMSDEDVKDLMYTYGYIEDEIDESLKESFNLEQELKKNPNSKYYDIFTDDESFMQEVGFNDSDIEGFRIGDEHPGYEGYRIVAHASAKPEYSEVLGFDGYDTVDIYRDDDTGKLFFGMLIGRYLDDIDSYIESTMDKYLEDDDFDESLNEAKKPKYWNSIFATKVIDDYKRNKLTLNNIEEWETEYNNGIKPNKPLGTKEILRYYIDTKEDPRNESLDEKVEKGSKISKRKSTLPGGKYSEPEPDEFDLIQMELSSAGDWDKLQGKTKFPKITTKKRYPADDIGQDYDGNTIIFGTKDSDFDFARKVADAYELEISDPIVDKKDPNKMKVIIETSVLVDPNS